ncbi:MAG: EamA family transporter RarD [Pseudomonadota bacterium]
MSTEQAPGEQKTGVAAAVAAYVMWGLLPLYLIALRGTSAEQVLIHRILWSIPFGALIISARKQWPDVIEALRTPKVLIPLIGTSLIIGINWLIYIMAVQGQQIFEASLGYYINPLIYMLVGVAVLGERLSTMQKVAVVLAAIGVTILTLSGGKFPVVSLALGITFTAYGYLRKVTVVGAMPGLFIETLILAPIAAIWLFAFIPDASRAFGTTTELTILLIAAGPVTVLPLLCFAIGARRLPLSTIGFLQFIGPTLQFVIGVIDGQPFTLAHQLCFGFIWLAAGVFAFDALRKARALQPSVSKA